MSWLSWYPLFEYCSSSCLSGPLLMVSTFFYRSLLRGSFSRAGHIDVLGAYCPVFIPFIVSWSPSHLLVVIYMLFFSIDKPQSPPTSCINAFMLKISFFHIQCIWNLVLFNIGLPHDFVGCSTSCWSHQSLVMCFHVPGWLWLSKCKFHKVIILFFFLRRFFYLHMSTGSHLCTCYCLVTPANKLFLLIATI